MIKLHITNVIYGNEYTDTFLYTLPSQLANFQYLKKTSYTSIYRIYTTDSDKSRILKSNIFQQISKLTEIEFVSIDKFFKDNAHSTMNACHNDIIITANKENAPMIFLLPDIIISENFFKKICNILSKNKRLLMGPALRLYKEDFKSSIKSSELINIKPRDLVKKALPHFHQLTYDVFWDYSNKIYCWPSILCWMLDNNNILIRGFHIHPIMIWPENLRARSKITIDADYLIKCCPDQKKWEVLENSDEGVLFELTTKKRKNLGNFFANRLKTLNDFTQNHLLYSHILFAQSKIYLYSDDYKKTAESIRKENQSDKIINLVTKPYNNFLYRKYIWPLLKIKHSLYIKYFIIFQKYKHTLSQKFVLPLLKIMKYFFSKNISLPLKIKNSCKKKFLNNFLKNFIKKRYPKFFLRLKFLKNKIIKK